MDWWSSRKSTISGSGDRPPCEDTGKVISLSEYRRRRSDPSDDDPPRPTPQAARAVGYAGQRGCTAVAGRPSEFAIQ